MSGYWGKSGQADKHSHETIIAEVHTDIRYSGLYLRALAAFSRLSGADQLKSSSSKMGPADQMIGAYIELGYDVFRLINIDQELYPHLRIERIDSQFKPAHETVTDKQYNQMIYTFGIAYKPIHQISVKADYSLYTNKAEKGVNQLNFALGYLF